MMNCIKIAVNTHASLCIVTDKDFILFHFYFFPNMVDYDTCEGYLRTMTDDEQTLHVVVCIVSVVENILAGTHSIFIFCPPGKPNNVFC